MGELNSNYSLSSNTSAKTVFNIVNPFLPGGNFWEKQMSSYEEIDYNADVSEDRLAPELPPTSTEQIESYEYDLGYVEDCLKDAKKRQRELEKERDNLSSWLSGAEQMKRRTKGKVIPRGYASKRAQLNNVKAELKAIEEEIAFLEALKIQIPKLKKEYEYSSLKEKEDFDELTEVKLTEEEAYQITCIYTSLYNTAFSSAVTTDDFYDYDKIKKLYDDDPSVFRGIDWDAVERAYEKGFSIYEVVMQNPSLVEASFEMDIFPSTIPEGEGYTLGEFAHKINFMTEEEQKIILYLYNTKGTKGVNEYLKFKQQEWNSREGFCLASVFLTDLEDSKYGEAEKFFKTMLKGTGDGVENFFEGIDNALGGMDGVVSVSQYEAMYIINWVSEEDIDKFTFLTEEEREKLKEIKGLSSSRFLQGTYEISSSIGNMIPSMMASAAASIVGTPAGGRILGTVLMGLSSGGNAAESAYQNGNSFWQSVFYGTLSGAAESCLGYFLGGIPGLSKIDNLSGLSGYVLKMLREGGEEALQSIIDPFLNSLATGAKLEFNWEEVQKAGIYGIITAGLLNGGELIINGTKIAINGLSQETIDIIDECKQLGLKVNYSKICDSQYIDSLKAKLKIIDGMNNGSLINNKIDGKTPKYEYTLEAKQKNISLELQSKYPGTDLSVYSFSELKRMYPDDIKELTIKQYKDIVYNAKQGNALWDASKRYDAYNGVGSFNALDDATKASLAKDYVKSTTGYDDIVKYADAVSSKTVGILERYELEGKFKEGFTAYDVLLLIQDDVDPAVYLKESVIREWKIEWLNCDAPNGMVNSYTFQGEQKGIVSYTGGVGNPTEGMFSMPESRYEWIMDPKNGVFDANGNCIDRAKLTELTGGVDFGTGGIVVIKQTIPIDSLKMATGNLDGAFIGEWVPGAKTCDGVTEGITPATHFNKSTNTIVSSNSVSFDSSVTVNGHSYNITTEVSIFGTVGDINIPKHSGTDVLNKIS